MTDGIGAAARFNYPTGVVYSATGDVLYVADSNNLAVRRIAVASAAVTTISTMASLCWCVCVSTDGMSLFVTTDTAVWRVRVATNSIEALAGSPSAVGYIDGVGAAARFNNLRGVALTSDETSLVVSDYLNRRVRHVNLTGYAVTTVAGSEAQGSTDGPGLNASFQYLLGTKWHCNSSSKVCGALVADQNSNAVRFVAMFNYRRTETRSVTFAPSSVSVATVASVTPTVVVQYRKPTFTQSARPGSSSLSLRKESALTQTKSERHFLTSARKVTRSASATRARSAAASRALPEETLSEQTLPEQTLREQTVAVQQSLVLVSITASENADHTPSSRHTHTLPRVHLTATKSLPHEQRFDHSIASTWMSRDLLVSAAKSLSLVSMSVEDYCGTPDIELVPALRLFENSSESVTIRHAIQGNGPGETSLTVSDLCSVGGSINCVLVDPQGESSSSWTIVLEAANASKTVHIVFGFVAPILWTLDSAVAEGEITTLIPIVDDVTSSLHQRGFVSLSAALGDLGTLRCICTQPAGGWLPMLLFECGRRHSLKATLLPLQRTWLPP